MLQESEILHASVLIVDDEKASVQQLEGLLQQAGYKHVTSTRDPGEARALDRSTRFDLILLDLQMPGADAFQVMDGLKSERAEDYFPVVVLIDQPEYKLRALQAGARDFISKPFDPIEVKLRIHNMLVVRLLYKKLEDFNRELEHTVQLRTAELRDSEARYRSLIELASDWYWEQDADGNFTRVSGPVLEMLGIRGGPLDDCGESSESGPPGELLAGWDEAERQTLRATIAARQPVLDFAFNRVNADQSRQQFRVSGEPMFDRHCRFIGYRGVGVEVITKMGREAANGGHTVPAAPTTPAEPLLHGAAERGVRAHGSAAGTGSVAAC